MQRLASRLSPGVLTKETFVTIIAFDLRLLSKLANIDRGDTLEEGHALENRFNRTGRVQLIKEALNGWHDLHQALHDLLRHFQHNGSRLCAGGCVALLTGKHAMLTHIFATSQDSNRPVFAVRTGGGELEAALQNEVHFPPELSLMCHNSSWHKSEQFGGSDKVQQVIIRYKLWITEHRLLTQAAKQKLHIPSRWQVVQHAAHIYFAVP